MKIQVTLEYDLSKSEEFKNKSFNEIVEVINNSSLNDPSTGIKVINIQEVSNG
jgi:hypothetical protein